MGRSGDCPPLPRGRQCLCAGEAKSRKLLIGVAVLALLGALVYGDTTFPAPLTVADAAALRQDSPV